MLLLHLENMLLIKQFILLLVSLDKTIYIQQHICILMKHDPSLINHIDIITQALQI